MYMYGFSSRATSAFFPVRVSYFAYVYAPATTAWKVWKRMPVGMLKVWSVRCLRLIISVNVD